MKKTDLPHGSVKVNKRENEKKNGITPGGGVIPFIYKFFFKVAPPSGGSLIIIRTLAQLLETLVGTLWNKLQFVSSDSFRAINCQS